MKTKRDRKGKEGSGSVKRTLLFSLLIFCGLAIIGIGSAAAAPSVSVSPASTTDLSPGDPFSINVSVDSESYNLRACNIDLTYNSTALSVVSVTYENLLGTVPTNALDMSNLTDDGCITSMIARITSTNPSAPASGTYITVNFAVKSGAADATYALDLSSVTLKDENNDAIPGVVVTDGTATVGEAPATPSVAISPASTTGLSPGDPFSIDVLVNSLTYNLRACNIDLTYDSTALSVVGVTYENLLGTVPTNALDMSNLTDDGCITSMIARITSTNPSAPASGTYITVNFAVKSGAADATYALDLSSVTLKDENNDAIPGVVVTDGTATVGAAVTLTWQVEPPASVTQGDDVTFRVGFSETADYYFRIENSSGGVVWRYPTTGTNTAMNPTAKTWTTTTDTPTGDYTIIININDVDNADTKTVTVQGPPEEQVPISDALDSYYKPDIARGTTGNIYVAFEGTTGIDFAKSTNVGVSFSAQIPVSTAGVDAAIATYGENDVYAVWFESNEIYYARSTNGGDSFETKVQVSDAGESIDGNPDIAVNSTGVIYVVWDGDDKIYIDKSTDGTAFGTDVSVNDSFAVVGKPSIAIDGNDNILVAWDGRISGMTNHVYLAKSTNGGAAFSTPVVRVDDSGSDALCPSVVVDPADSNKVYVAWQDARAADGGDIYAAASTDGGATFGTGEKVNDDTTDTAQKFPCMAVNSSGAIFVVWQDGRNYTSDYDVYFAGSTDGGSTFSENRKVNIDDTKAVTPTLTVDDTNAFVAWRDTDDNRIYFRKMLLVPEVPTPVLTTITVTPATANVAVDGTQLFTATAYDQNSEVMADVDITWTSSNETVGTVSPATNTTVADGTATTTFTALAAGTTNVTAESAGVSETAEVNVTTCPRYDINEDGNVDFKDLAVLGLHYGETTTSPYPRYDINKDGNVDFKDLAVLGLHYGETNLC